MTAHRLTITLPGHKVRIQPPMVLGAGRKWTCSCGWGGMVRGAYSDCVVAAGGHLTARLG